MTTDGLAPFVHADLGGPAPAGRVRGVLIGAIAVTLIAVIGLSVYLVVGRSAGSVSLADAVGTWRSRAAGVGVASLDDSLTVAPDGTFRYAISAQVSLPGILGGLGGTAGTPGITCTGKAHVDGGDLVFVSTSGLCQTFVATVRGDSMTIRGSGTNVPSQTLIRSAGH
jgi:hypothetical protein